MNVIGEPIDEKGPIESDKYRPIHRDSPAFIDQGAGTDLLITGKKRFKNSHKEVLSSGSEKFFVWNSRLAFFSLLARQLR